MITLYKDAMTINDPKYVGIDTALKRIKEGKSKDKIEAIRKTEGKERVELKKQLPCIIFAGKFKTRNDKDIEEHSGFCVIDFDHVDVEETKKLLISKPYIYSCFTSPSGDGVKGVVKIPPDATKHSGYYLGLVKTFTNLDTTSKNLSRVCFESYDPDIYINKDATEFTEYVEEEKPKPQIKQNISTDYSKLNISVNMIRNAVDGEKHDVLLKASKLAGGYIASGKIIEFDAVNILEQEIQKRNIDDFGLAQGTIKDGIEYGKLTPLHEIYREIKSKTKLNNAVITAKSLKDRMVDGFENGKRRGETTHFDKLDRHFTWRRRDNIMLIGHPNHGKSELALQLMLVKSVKDSVKWGCFCPENFPASDFYDLLIHSYVGKTTDPHFKEDQMSKEEYLDAIDFITEHFFYVYPEENHSLSEIHLNFEYLIKEYNIDGVLRDPYNKIDFDENIRDDKQVKQYLKDVKRFSNKHDIYDITIGHPGSGFEPKLNKGEYDHITIYQIEGGKMWSKGMDVIISILRPKYFNEPDSTIVEVKVQKVRAQKLVGIPGMIELDYSRKTNRYYFDYNENPLGERNRRLNPDYKQDIEAGDDPPF